MAQMTPEVSKLLEQALSLSVEEQGRWRIPRFSTSVARWVKEYKRPGKPKSEGESQNWNPARHKPRTIPRSLVPHGLPAEGPAPRGDRHIARVQLFPIVWHAVRGL